MPRISKEFTVSAPDSIEDYTIDFVNDVVSGVTVVSAVWTLSLRLTIPGYTPDPNPSLHISNPATVSGTTTTQRIFDLWAGNDYVVVAKAVFSNGQEFPGWGIIKCRAIDGLVVNDPNQQVTFDYILWAETFPELSYIDEVHAQMYFNQAVTFHRNDGGGPVSDNAQQLRLLNLVTAHLAARYAEGQILAGSPFTGSITSASEGSVSVSGQPLMAPGTQAWWLTTKYGSDYWFATAPYRTMHYRVARPRIFDPMPWGPWGQNRF